jgi:branched-chain amino acid transport system substrate-binding protein
MLRRIRRAAGVGVLATGLVAALAGCTGGPAPTPSPTPPPPSGDGVLRIGTLFTTTGEGAAAAAGQTAAVYAAARAIDGTGGVLGSPVDVITRNGGTAGDGTGTAAFAELVERGADVVIGPSDMELAAELAPLAAAAGIPLISPSATGARPDGTTGVFRTVPSAAVQATALGTLLAGEGARVALLRSDDAAGQAIAAGLVDGLVAADAELVADVIPGADPLADVQQIAGATPDVVVLATNDGGEATVALLEALSTAGLGGDTLWVTGGALVRYGDAPVSLEGVHGIQSGVSVDPEFLAQVRQEDPGARSLRYAANAYDATVLVALAAVLAGDDGGPSVEAALRAATSDGIPCHSFGECVDVLTTETDIDYDGPSGSFSFDDAGDRPTAAFVRYRYGADNRPAPEDASTG